MPDPRFIISGGGTGGHIFPALAIADELKKRFPKAAFLFVGARDRMEMQRVPAAGYAIEGLWISGIQRKLSLKNLSFPLKLISSLMKAGRIIAKFKPDLVIGTGGFASGPLLQSASQKGIPCLLQEQNSYPGITNRLLAKKAKAICVAYPRMERFFPAEKIVFTGNPIRRDLLAAAPEAARAKKSLGLHPDKPLILVLGGSQGSARINELIAGCIEQDLLNHGQVFWQCGALYFERLQHKFDQRLNEGLRLNAFIDNMAEAYAAADLVISRAGAGTLSELAVLQKASVLIPSPNVAEDHQTKNARALSEKNAAVLFPEKQSVPDLMTILKEHLAQPEKRLLLAENIAAFARPQATAHIVDEIEKLLDDA